VPPELSIRAAYDQPMRRKPDPERIYLARRAAVASRLRGSGMPEDDAERLLAAWETEAGELGLDRLTADYWQRGSDWIDGRRP
jgi:hypothetical protein